MCFTRYATFRLGSTDMYVVVFTIQSVTLNIAAVLHHVHQFPPTHQISENYVSGSDIPIAMASIISIGIMIPISTFLDRAGIHHISGFLISSSNLTSATAGATSDHQLRTYCIFVIYQRP
ncbi:hypothetical protein EX30DRAFT_66749 [Ascodesmis nigricans]|uniref:Uncharacterized protein n=1 Tax=Ascodesmis nigricans TaxID=341454 RepID=A0A4S2MTX5_9PEZI|nr:hypothetical protein EX30DRAFT_66749 [Ascodesmis nigricans]